jgi:hypothetical protein
MLGRACHAARASSALRRAREGVSTGTAAALPDLTGAAAGLGTDTGTLDALPGAAGNAAEPELAETRTGVPTTPVAVGGEALAGVGFVGSGVTGLTGEATGAPTLAALSFFVSWDPTTGSLPAGEWDRGQAMVRGHVNTSRADCCLTLRHPCTG